MAKYARGTYVPRNPLKYIGKKTPKYRSSWELMFMQVCDNHPAITQWSSESIFIPYQNPLTGKHTIYVPDFMIIYQDSQGKKHAEVIEIKPLKEMTILNAGRSARDRLMAVQNKAKWKAAMRWCHQQGLVFRVINETQLFHQKFK